MHRGSIALCTASKASSWAVAKPELLLRVCLHCSWECAQASSSTVDILGGEQITHECSLAHRAALSSSMSEVLLHPLETTGAE